MVEARSHEVLGSDTELALTPAPSGNIVTLSLAC